MIIAIISAYSYEKPSVQKFAQVSSKENFKVVYYWTSLRVINRPPKDSSNKTPEMRKTCPNHDVLMQNDVTYGMRWLKSKT